jgi:hypothetical protein
MDDADLSYEAFRAKLRELGPPIVVNALDGEEMLNPDLEALVDKLTDQETEKSKTPRSSRP